MGAGAPLTKPAAQGLYDPAYEHDACGVGFVVHIKGQKSHAIVEQALTILKNLLHRGACGCEENTGDGVGILIQMPHAFLKRVCNERGIDLPAAGGYGCGLIFLPRDPAQSQWCQQQFETIIREEKQKFIGWRDVPTNDAEVGPTARACEPGFKQIFIGRARIGGYDDLRRYLGRSVKDPDAVTYAPVVAVFAVAALMALAGSIPSCTWVARCAVSAACPGAACRQSLRRKRRM